MIIKEIFSGKYESVHDEFLKFSRGEFKDKYLIECKKQAGRWAVKTSSEYANFLVRRGLEIAEGKIYIKGAIISTINIEAEFIERIKQFMGVKQAVIDGEIESGKLLELIEKYPRAFFALSFSLPDYELKIKARAPKSAKPSASGEKMAKADFCTLKTSNREILREILFDINIDSFKEIKIRHTIKINEIIYPKDIKNMKPGDVRENSKRKGVIIREIDIDGVKRAKEAEFEA